MTDTLRQLAAARVRLESWKEHVGICQICLEHTQRYADLIEAKEWEREQQEMVADLTDHVRAEALAAYQETAETKPWPGVQVKIYTEIEFDETEALVWCREYMPTLLNLDVTRFKKVAPHIWDAPITITKVPKATIARDLGEYLAEEASDDCGA